MKLTTFAQSLNDLNLIKDQGLQEVILGHQDFSRFGKLKNEEFFEFSKRAKELGLKVIFEWDILMTENTFAKLAHEIVQFLDSFDSLRVQDPGALEWGFKNTTKPLQFIAENGNHNLLGLQGWVDHVQGRMERIALSIELPKNKIEEYCNTLKVPCELLGLGRILLFYTPRLLLSPLSEDKLSYNQDISAVGESEESPHKGFPIIENRHGTFMFHIKDFCLVDFAQELKLLGLSFFRIDLRFSAFDQLKEIKALTEEFNENLFGEFKEKYPQDLMRGFYLVNKTDVLFPKLKNHRLQSREGNYLGEVLEAEKGSHLAIFVKNSKGLRKSDKLKIVHPKGEIFEALIYSLRNLSLEEVEYIEPQKTALIQFVGGVWVKSHVFYQQPEAH
jgi:putative protease